MSADSRSGRAAAPLAFKAIRSARAFEEIAAQIRAELAAGRLQVGSRLPPERALAEQFGVSRNTLREALRSLEHAGLIRLQKGASGGAFISERSGEAIVNGLMDLYHVGAIQPARLTEARIWIESVVVREACRRATPEQLAELRRNVDEAEQAQQDKDFARRAERHLEFHRILARMTGNPIIEVFMDSLMTVLGHFVKTIGDYDNLYVIPSRRRFLKHVEEGDVNGAVAEMESSLLRLQRNYLSRVDTAAARPPAPSVPAAAAGARTAARKPTADRRATAPTVQPEPDVPVRARRATAAAGKPATRPGTKAATPPATKLATKTTKPATRPGTGAAVRGAAETATPRMTRAAAAVSKPAKARARSR